MTDGGVFVVQNWDCNIDQRLRKDEDTKNPDWLN